MSYEEDYYVNRKISELRMERNVLLSLGFCGGAIVAYLSIPLWMWVTGLI